MIKRKRRYCPSPLEGTEELAHLVAKLLLQRASELLSNRGSIVLVNVVPTTGFRPVLACARRMMPCRRSAAPLPSSLFPQISSQRDKKQIQFAPSSPQLSIFRQAQINVQHRATSHSCSQDVPLNGQPRKVPFPLK